MIIPWMLYLMFQVRLAKLALAARLCSHLVYQYYYIFKDVSILNT
jgi:hypothetical protein